MSESIEIRDHGTYVGAVTFDESPTRLQAERTADGFKLRLPITITLKLVPMGAAIPLLGNFKGTIYAGGDSGPQIEIGEMRMDALHKGSCFTNPEHAGEYDRDAYMIWAGSLAQLAVYEKLRDGRQPTFEIHFTGELSFVLQGVHPNYTVISESQEFFHRRGNLRISYPKEVWVEMLRSLGIAENVLVEIPLPGRVSKEWDEVLRALAEARKYFEQGGATGWKGCIAAVRLALEKWQGIEKEDMGPGWKAPSMQERKDRTKKQRLANLRWHLYQCAHLGPHSSAEDWTRDDAILLLSTLSALLAERKP